LNIATEMLAAIGRNGRWMLVAGLVAGVVLPSAATLVRPLLTPLIALILFVSVLRVSPDRLRSALGHAGRDIPILIGLQFLLPLAFAGIFRLVGYSGDLADALILMAAAAPIAGGPGIAVMTGLDGMTALRLLVWGTLMLPVTSLLPLQIVFSGQSISVVGPALRLTAIIFAAGGLAVLVRLYLLKRVEGRRAEILDGISALLLAAFVLGLMDAIQPLLLSQPLQVVAMLTAAFAASFGLQAATRSLAAWLGSLRGGGDFREEGALAIVAGNRNIGLFLAALPAAMMDPMMVFVGCYQIPMFLTPILLTRYYRREGSALVDPEPANGGRDRD